jgi:hypothetical protein
MEQDKQKLNELKTEFKKELLNGFENWATAEGIAPTNEAFINYIFNRSIIPDKQVIKFMVVSCYPKILEAEGGRKMRALYSLENIIPLKITQLQSIIKHYSNNFKFKKTFFKHEEKF